MIWVGQFAHLYVRFVSMKRMYIIVEAQGDWHSLSASVLNRYSTNRVSTMYIQMTDYFWHRIQRISECVTVRVLVRVSPSVFCFALFVSC